MTTTVRLLLALGWHSGHSSLLERHNNNGDSHTLLGGQEITEQRQRARQLLQVPPGPHTSSVGCRERHRPEAAPPNTTEFSSGKAAQLLSSSPARHPATWHLTHAAHAVPAVHVWLVWRTTPSQRQSPFALFAPFEG